MVLDTDDDGLANFEEEAFGTNPARDSDMDLIDDIVEVANNGTIALFTGMGESCNEPLLQSMYALAPSTALSEVVLDGHGRRWVLRSL